MDYPRRNFERIYDLTERVLPTHVLAAPTPSPVDAKKALLVESAHALGVATARELADYFRIHQPTAKGLVAELAEEGAIERVQVNGWPHPAFAPPALKIPRKAPSSRALLSPFDPLVWFRPRTERLFDFHYRIEIYTPQAKRKFGYYVLPFLHNGTLKARVDLKAERAQGVLAVRGAHMEKGADRDDLASAMATELGRMAKWLGLGAIRVSPNGDLAGSLAKLL